MCHSLHLLPDANTWHGLRVPGSCAEEHPVGSSIALRGALLCSGNGGELRVEERLCE